MHLRVKGIVEATHPIFLKEQGVVIPPKTPGMIERVGKHNEDLIVAWEWETREGEARRATTVSGPVKPQHVKVIH